MRNCHHRRLIDRVLYNQKYPNLIPVVQSIRQTWGRQFRPDGLPESTVLLAMGVERSHHGFWLPSSLDRHHLCRQ
jgi:hypothetical protein